MKALPGKEEDRATECRAIEDRAMKAMPGKEEDRATKCRAIEDRAMKATGQRVF